MTDYRNALITNPSRAPRAIREWCMKVGFDAREIPEGGIEQLGNLGGITLVIPNYLTMNRETIEHFPNLEALIVPASGIDLVDTQVAKANGIKVWNCPNYATIAVAEYALALIFSLLKNIPSISKNPQTASVPRNESLLGVEFTSAHVVIVGDGRIGKHLGRLLSLLGISVRIQGKAGGKARLMNVLTSASVVCLTLPHTSDTDRYFDRDCFRALRAGTMLVNVSRAGVVDTLELVRALQSGVVRSAALDVVDDEDSEYSAEVAKLKTDPNVYISPHIASNTKEATDALLEEVQENVKQFYAGGSGNVS